MCVISLITHTLFNTTIEKYNKIRYLKDLNTL
jgi:hypothetical protein